ncbi:MAG: alpha-galactosidase [Clostridia bacterium]|nr:alpha-galactosidase [Clostridia bacterium]
MSICFNEATDVFQLDAGQSSYVMKLVGGYLMHLYYGKRLDGRDHSYMLRLAPRGSFSPNPDPQNPIWSLDAAPLEYPSYGTSDLRSPAYHVQFADGSTASELKFVSHRIVDGKPRLEGLPQVYCESGGEAQSLEIVLRDEYRPLEVILTYTAFDAMNAIVRSSKIVNKGNDPIRIKKASSASVDYVSGRYEEIHLQGSWARERHIERAPLTHGIKMIESRRGHSSHDLNPFFALVSPETTEDFGDAYGYSLIYSGNFKGSMGLDQYGSTRAMIGISDFDFEWLLAPGEAFQTPEAVLVYSNEGLGGMSRTYHRLYRTRLCRGVWRDKRRPVLVNNWEATYFDFNEDKLVELAKQAKELGIEMLVMDDGWFGQRNDDRCSLGDWFVNRGKLPGGLEGLAARVKEQGLKFGIWFEPEMISRNSRLFEQHPDWCVHVKNRRQSEGRSQLVLDMSRKDVCDYILETLTGILKSAPIDYVKWDFNRSLTEMGSALLPPERQREFAHRFVLGTYSVMEALTSRFPEVLFEGCSGGGGRFDPGILYYMPQIWTSDDTDAVERLKIQYGTSLAYPFSTMGAHVAAVPNHQCGRVTAISTRGHAAMTGAFGYELDLGKLSEEEKTQVRQQVAQYHQWERLISQGDLYRLQDPFKGNTAAWMFVSSDKKEALVFYYQVLSVPNPEMPELKLKGLDEKAVYTASDGGTYSGAQLMGFGLHVPYMPYDFSSYVWHLKA